MEKRYQVFVSSTYADLSEERKHVIQTLMEMDCIPAGMELFPAADQQQWEFIKRVIDDCDYYLLIIGGRYGSTTSDGISYTEKEFDYAVQTGLKVVALIHGQPDEIPFGKSEKDEYLREKLLSFKDKVMAGRLIKFWNASSELPGLVALSMTKTIKMYPAVGWVRASSVANESALSDLNELRKENSILQAQLAENKNHAELDISNIADIDSHVAINVRYRNYGNAQNAKYYNFDCLTSWREIFSLLSPFLVDYLSEAGVKIKLQEILLDKEGKSGVIASVNEQDFKTIKIQLQAYKLIKCERLKATDNTMHTYWSLTPKGEKIMIESRVIRSPN